MFSLVSKLKKKKKEKDKEKLRINILNNIKIISKKIKLKKEINFLHSGHLGDIINSLPYIKEISKNKKCNLFINLNKKIEISKINNLHPAKNFFLKDNSYKKLYTLLKKQFKNYIVIMRSLRRQNNHIKFKFLEKNKKLVFIGLHNEYLELKKQINNLQFYDCKNFLEMAEIINSSKLFIGNLSFGYTIAEGLKKPRLVESYLDFPLIYPNGLNASEFYFQIHFQENVKNILKF